MSFLVALLLCAQAPTPLPVEPNLPTVPLEVKSSYVARKPPIFITVAPDPSVANYEWVWPLRVIAKARDNVLEVTYAPAGECVIDVVITYGEIKGERIVYTKKYGREKFVVADVGPGPAPVPPGPGPTPPIPVPTVDPFIAIFQAAYAAELDTEKAQKTIDLAGLYNVSSNKVFDVNYVKTNGDVITKMRQASFNLKIAPDRILTIRQSIEAELNKILPRDPALVLTDTTRKLMSDTYKRVELALGQCK